MGSLGPLFQTNSKWEKKTFMGDLILCGRSEVSITEMPRPEMQRGLVCWKTKDQRGMMPRCICGIFYATQPEIRT